MPEGSGGASKEQQEQSETVAVVAPSDSHETPLKLLHCGTFERAAAGKVNHLKFKGTAIIKEVRVVRNREKPHRNSQTSFQGASYPTAFEYEMFALDLSRPSCRFEPITDRIKYSERADTTIPHSIASSLSSSTPSSSPSPSPITHQL
jgi:hypothetical protein